MTELYITYPCDYAAAQFFVSWQLRPIVTETEETLEFDVKYYLLQMKHKSTLFSHTINSGRFRAEGVYRFHVRTRLSCQS